jgi:alkylation response protein AidB-like acyl-CoA dehydrogenase
MSEDRLAAQVHDWIEANWDRSITVREWWFRLMHAGYTYPTWPAGVGGSRASTDDARTIASILAERGVIGPPRGGVAATLAAPTILEHGSEDQIVEFVRPIAAGKAAWCQLFSEPGAGSDLASVGTWAELQGDEWVVNGQKVWNSGADLADFGMLLARTDREASKHGGMTYFVIDMHQPGIEVRPLRCMNGTSRFCEVFLSGARVRKEHVIGAINHGWSVARSTLIHERNMTAGRGLPGLVPAVSGSRGDLDRKVGEVLDRHHDAAEHTSAIPTGAVPANVMIELTRSFGKALDPTIRQELARYLAQIRINGWTMRRIGAAGGKLTGADGSIAKIATSRICQMSRDLSYRIVGAQGMLMGPGSPVDGELQAVNLASPGARIGGGTDEIQLNVLGERALGLPREPGSDADAPYRTRKVGPERALSSAEHATQSTAGTSSLPRKVSR